MVVCITYNVYIYIYITYAPPPSRQVVVCDALSLPFRDESVDAAVSVAVIHHLATTERRVRALRELARVLRIGGRLIVTVWAMEQRTRKVHTFTEGWGRGHQEGSYDCGGGVAAPGTRRCLYDTGSRPRKHTA